MGLTELGHVFQILYMSYRAYTYLTDLILILRNLYLSYRSYTVILIQKYPLVLHNILLVQEYP